MTKHRCSEEERQRLLKTVVKDNTGPARKGHYMDFPEVRTMTAPVDPPGTQPAKDGSSAALKPQAMT
jgi:hypothetical protein